MFVFVICCDRKWMKQLQKKNWATSKRGMNPKTILSGLALVQIQKLMRSVIDSRHKLILKGIEALKMMKWRRIHQMKQLKEL